MEGTLSDKKPSREPYWYDLDTNSKIERLRQVVKQQEDTITKMETYLNKLIDHYHIDGKIVKVIEHPNAESYGGFHHRRYPNEWF